MFDNLSREQIFNQRKTRFLQIGRDQGFKKPSDAFGEKLGYVEPSFSKLNRFVMQRKNLLVGTSILLLLAIILSIFL